MELGLRKYKDICIIDVKNDLDIYSSHKLKDMVSKLMDKNIRYLIINLENVEYIDSSGIGALIHIFTDIKKKKRLLRIVGVHGSVRKVIKLTKLLDYFPIADNTHEAIQQLDRKQRVKLL